MQSAVASKYSFSSFAPLRFFPTIVSFNGMVISRLQAFVGLRQPNIKRQFDLLFILSPQETGPDLLNFTVGVNEDDLGR